MLLIICIIIYLLMIPIMYGFLMEDSKGGRSYTQAGYKFLNSLFSIMWPLVIITILISTAINTFIKFMDVLNNIGVWAHNKMINK